VVRFRRMWRGIWVWREGSGEVEGVYLEQGSVSGAGWRGR